MIFTGDRPRIVSIRARPSDIRWAAEPLKVLSTALVWQSVIHAVAALLCLGRTPGSPPHEPHDWRCLVNFIILDPLPRPLVPIKKHCHVHIRVVPSF